MTKLNYVIDDTGGFVTAWIDGKKTRMTLEKFVDLWHAEQDAENADDSVHAIGSIIGEVPEGKPNVLRALTFLFAIAGLVAILFLYFQG